MSLSIEQKEELHLLDEELSKNIKIFVEKSKNMSNEINEVSHMLYQEKKEAYEKCLSQIDSLNKEKSEKICNIDKDDDEEFESILAFYENKIYQCLGDYQKREESIYKRKEEHEKAMKELEIELHKESDKIYFEYHFKLDKIKKKNYKNVISPKVQQYNPETLSYIKTFNSISETVYTFRQILNIPNFSDSTLKAAFKGNYEYAGYRWHIIDRNAEDIPYKIEPTQQIYHSKKNCLIARLNQTKDTILEVYPSQKDAAEAMKLSSITPITVSIKKGTKSRDYYWDFYDNCLEEVKSKFFQNGGTLPNIKIEIPGAKPIHKIDPNTKEVLETFPSIKDVIVKYKISREVLKKAIQNQTPHHGFYWAYA